jgi:glycosyltransferase involved in cell wall biosynthesis
MIRSRESLSGSLRPVAIRAAHIVRDDHATNFGGDIVHLRGHVAGLRGQGIDAFETTWQDAPDDVDVLHLYNIERPLTLHAHVAGAATRWPKAKIVITPIFWPWKPSMVLRSRDLAIVYRATRNAAKTRATWLHVRRALARADAVSAFSHRELHLLSRYYRLPAGPSWHVAASGLRVDDWPARTGPADRAGLATELGLGITPSVVVTCVGRIEPLKNQRTLVKAVARLPDAALVLVGARRDRRYADSVLRLAERELPGRFAWLDRVPHADVRRILCNSDVNALVSFREVVGLASLEAAASGCELVVTTWGSTEEYYGDLAHYCDAYSSRDMADAIARSVHSPRQPELRLRVESHYDWSASGRIIASWYDRLLGGAT